MSLENEMSLEDFSKSLDPEQPSDKTNVENEDSDSVEDNEDPEASEEQTEEETEDSEEEKTKEPDVLEWEREGQKVTAPKEELIRAYEAREEMQKDYTQKTQRLADDARKAQEQSVLEFQFINQFAGDIAVSTSLRSQLAQYDALNWQQLSQEDPQMYTMRLAERNDLVNRIGQADAIVQQKRTGYFSHLEQTLDAKRRETVDHMTKVDKAFNRDRLNALFQYAEKYGFPAEELNQSLTDKRTVHMFNDLYKKAVAYDELVKKQPQTKQRVAEAPSKVSKRTVSLPTREEQLIKRASKGGPMSTKDFAGLLGMTSRK